MIQGTWNKNSKESRNLSILGLYGVNHKNNNDNNNNNNNNNNWKERKKGVKIRNNFEGFIYQLAQSRNEVSWLSRELAQE